MTVVEGKAAGRYLAYMLDKIDGIDPKRTFTKGRISDYLVILDDFEL